MTGSLMDIWNSGVKMPFLVCHPESGQAVMITNYYWPRKFFEGEMQGATVALTGEWQLWTFVREA